MNPIIAVVGPSGAGKSTLMDKAIAKMPERLGRIVSFTTREKRSDADLLYYEFVTREEVEKRKADGILVQLIEFNGNYYGSDRPHIEATLKDKLGLLAVVEYGIHTFTDAGYDVVVVKVEPKGYVAREGRKADDAARAQIPIKIDKTIVNDFSAGGLDRAVNELVEFLKTV